MTRQKSSLSRLAAALLVVLPALLLGACTKTYDYHDYASKEAFFNYVLCKHLHKIWYVKSCIM